MSALTPARPALRAVRPCTPLQCRAGLPPSRTAPSWPFRLQPPHIPPMPLYHVLTASPRTGTPFLSGPAVFILSASGSFRASPLFRGLAGHAKPNRVRYPADWLFASHCSPPRLTTTQLRSATELGRHSGVDSHHSDVVRLKAHGTPASLSALFLTPRHEAAKNIALHPT
jgi:hypothetical protein